MSSNAEILARRTAAIPRGVATSAPVFVDRAENVYPMIPGGAAHNEIRLSPPDDGEHMPISEKGMVLV